MARPWAWGLGLIAVTGVAAICARSIGAESHMVASAAPVDPACVSGPDYSAAVCNAASAGEDAPLVTAGRDIRTPTTALDSAAASAAPVIASAETTAIPAPAAPYV